MKKPIQIFLIEDNPGDADLACDTFERAKHPIKVSVANDGVEAMRHLRGQVPDKVNNRPDLILLDLNLPRMDGRQTLTEIKREESLRHIPVVVLTSSDSSKDITDCYALGASCYITKPHQLQEFRSTLLAVEDFWCSVAKLPG